MTGKENDSYSASAEVPFAKFLLPFFGEGVERRAGDRATPAS